ncbi:MAG: 6-phosphofructokinase [Clostridia bacterium]|nr:6-phosphofructokinase [Clostridia bacterium]
MKTIAVLTSGGDAPGMNAAIRAVVRTAVSLGLKVKGIKHGYDGLLKEEIIDLNARSVSDIISRGGTVLYTSRSKEFKTDEGVKKAAEICKKHGIEGIVTIGGDGTFMGAKCLSEQGIPCVGVPATIDNDIASTEYTIGFDTALNTAAEMIDKIRDTSQSHDRCSVVEVMGHKAGYMALQIAIAVGAVDVLVPELPVDLKAIIEHIKTVRKSGKRHFIVVVAEGIGDSHEIARIIELETGLESRATVLGHVQRGGSPTVRDRVRATQMGSAAVHLLNKDIGNRVISYKKGKIVDFDIFEAHEMTKTFDDGMVELAKETAI